MTGWSTNEALGQPVQSVFPTREQKTRTPGEDIVGRVLSEKRIIMLANNLAMVTRDGREVPVEASAAPIKDHQGKPVGVVLVFRDVTEKSRAKHVLEAHARELEWLNKAMVGRELRMIELKKEINELCRKSGAPTRYDV